ncbi:hypothetical protein [Streptomyces zingiberis]|uniref:Uncharacterized protein n=1 Tax=Streptomyces zingiberis TaxID=2053010 RepID=A0ABX1C488_9ACTN|nr:hypothetical protein [Streptomyces zingiberis]NJQ03468.1 hypothetical protein [Streptomyces zingiberis]
MTKWIVSIPTLREDPGERVPGVQLYVVEASHPRLARRAALDRAAGAPALRHRRGAALQVERLVIARWTGPDDGVSAPTPGLTG